MQTVFSLLLRAVLLVAGLVVAASLLLAVVILALGWSLRAAWCRLTGRPVMPFVMRIDPRGGFGRVWRTGPDGVEVPVRPHEAEPAQRQREIGDVLDVEVKEPRGRANP